MQSVLTVVLVLACGFAATFALMWGLQRAVGFEAPPGHGSRWARARRPITWAVAPDDNAAFLRELRRRIDGGHFRH